EVRSYYTYEEASEHVSDDDVHLWILDIMLDDKSGFDLIEEIRLQGRDIPVIFMSARDKEFDRIIGLEKGSDDYITKPFSPKELVLRVNNVIKRVYKNDNNRILIDGYELDEEQRKVFAGSDEIDLTTKEFDLLMMFIKNKGIAFSRDKILENVWEENYYGSDRVVDDTLRRLRKKLPNLNIHTIYGYGYRLG
ncbi:MAG: response regulator transcription factor, partial [Merdibacter sp.]|nr:response regulator transcription factor [Merdibacter sp.]